MIGELHLELGLRTKPGTRNYQYILASLHRLLEAETKLLITDLLHIKWDEFIYISR